MTRAVTGVSFGILMAFAAPALGQTSAGLPVPGPTARFSFEVASVKPALNSPPSGGATNQRGAGTGGGCPTSMKVDRGRIDFKCATVAMLIGYAFRLSPDRVTGPDWMTAVGSPRFNIAAVLPRGASENQVPEMFQALLADRFKLAIHRGTDNLPVYALVVAKGGLKVKEAPPGVSAPTSPVDLDAPPTLDGFYGDTESRAIPGADGDKSVTMLSNPRMGTVRQTDAPDGVQRWEAASISLAGLADLLDMVAPLPSPIIDTTGLKGHYQLVLEVSPRDRPGARRSISATAGDPPAADNPMADMAAAVLRGFNDGLLKLGLRLELRKGPVEILVVDHVEKTPTEN